MKTEEKIADAALTLFAERGFAETRMDAVAARAGVAKGTLYLHFDSKDALFREAIKRAIGPATGALDQLGSGADADPARTLAAFYQRIAEVIDSGRVGTILRLIVAESDRFPELADIYYRTVIDPALARIGAIVQAARDAGHGWADGMERYPQLLMAPAIMAAFWRLAFDRIAPMSTHDFLQTFANLIGVSDGEKATT